MIRSRPRFLDFARNDRALDIKVSGVESWTFRSRFVKLTSYAVPYLQEHRPDGERSGLWFVDDFHRLVGKFYRGRSGRAHAQGIRPRCDVVRCGRYVRQWIERRT